MPMSVIIPGRRAAPAGSPRGVTVIPRDDAVQWAGRQVEKIRSAWGAGRLAFPSWLDNFTEETPEQRNAYFRMLSDGVIKAAVRKMVHTVASQDPQTHPVNRDSPRERLAADLFRQALEMIGMDWTFRYKSHGLSGARKVATNILTGGVMQGWSVCEAVWGLAPVPFGPLKGLDTWRDFKARDTRTLWPEVDGYKNVEGIKVNSGPVHSIRGDDLRDIVMYSHNSIYESPLGISDMRAAYRPWWLKNVAYQMRALNLDRYTGPFLHGTYANQDQRAALETALDNAKGDGWITTPVGVMVEVLNLALTGSDAVFASTIADCDREILVGLLGSHLMVMEGQGGDRRGDTSQQSETSEIGDWYASALVGDIVTAQMGPPWYARNFADLPPCRTTWGTVSDSALMSSAKLDEQLLKNGVRMSRKERQQYYGRAEPADEADVLKPDPPKPPPGQPGQPGGGGQGPFFGGPPDDSFCGGPGGTMGPCPDPSKGDRGKGGRGGKKAASPPPAAAPTEVAEKLAATVNPFGEGMYSVWPQKGASGYVTGDMAAKLKGMGWDVVTDYGNRILAFPLEPRPSPPKAYHLVPRAALPDVLEKGLLPGDVTRSTKDISSQHGIDKVFLTDNPAKLPLWGERFGGDLVAVEVDMTKVPGQAYRDRAAMAAGPDEGDPGSFYLMGQTVPPHALKVMSGKPGDRFSAPPDDQFCGGPGGTMGPCPGGGKGEDDDKSPKEQAATLRQTIHETANGGEDVAVKLADAYHDHPAVTKVFDHLYETASPKFTTVGKHLGVKTEHVKDTNHRASDLKKLDRLSTSAIAQYSVAPLPAGSPEAADRVKVVGVLREAKLLAVRGLRHVEELKAVIRDHRGETFSAPPDDQFCGGEGGTMGPCPGPQTDEPASQQTSPARATAEKWIAGSSLPPALREKFTADMTAVLDKMPPGCRAAAAEAIGEYGGGITFHADTAAVTSALTSATGAKEKSRVGGFVVHHPGGDAVHVHIDGGSETDATNPEKAQGIYAHELGHAVDVGRKYSADPKWQAVWKSEIFNGKTLLSRYARESPTEGFAELHRALADRGVDATRTAFPKTMAFFKAKGLV